MDIKERSGTPKISVISASFNLARFLEDTIVSVANQSFRDFEHIVIDGGSTDGSVEILKRYPSIKWISEKDNGYEEAMRKGLAMARGRYIMNCAVSDGYLDRDWLGRCVEALEADPEVSLIWGFPRYLTEDGKLGEISYPEFHHSPPPQKHDFFPYWLNTKFWLPEGNLCVRREVFDKCFPAFEGFPEYLDVWLEFNYNFNTMGYLPHHIPLVANFGRTHKDQRLQRDAKIGLGQRKLNEYFKKVKHYRWKLLTGGAVHRYRDGKDNILPVKFSAPKFRREYIISGMKKVYWKMRSI